jgi:hypothetical protein
MRSLNNNLALPQPLYGNDCTSVHEIAGYARHCTRDAHFSKACHDESHPQMGHDEYLTQILPSISGLCFCQIADARFQPLAG